MSIPQIEKKKKNIKGDYTIKLNNNSEIVFSMKIIKNELLNQNIFSSVNIKDRINFFSAKAKETQKDKNVHCSKKDIPNNNNNKIRNSCVINKSFLEQINKNINNQKKIENSNNNNIINKTNKEKEINKKDNTKINSNNNNNMNRTHSIVSPTNNYNNMNETNDLNKTQSIMLPNKGNKISNFIKEKLNAFTNRNRSNNNNDNKYNNLNKSQTILNKNTDKNNNLNKSQDINIKKETKIIPNKQSIKQNETNLILKKNNDIQTQSSKNITKIFTKSASSSNLKINNNLKNKLPKLSTKQLEQLKIIDDTQSTSISSNRSSITELVLDSINYNIFLEQEKQSIKENKNIKERETFCEGFFIASFPKVNGKVIENSFSFRPPCGHIKCAKLPAMKPEIIMRYPLNDTKSLDINNLAASICFPTGIKICYFENNPSIMRDYVTPITNQKGERYYMMTYHFFHKMTNSEFTKTYEENPLKHHLRRFGEAYINLRGEELTEKIINEIQETLKYCEELGFKDFVYIPYCLCLISKYPYIREMEKCLQSIYYLMIKQINDDNIELNKLIMFLIHSVPIPINRNSKLKFYIPYYNNGIEIACPKLNDINIININVSMLLNLFSIDNIIIILRLILFEKKLLFVDDNYERLSNVIDIFISLIYPFQWIHTYIPIMSEEMINYIETFLPFVNGVHNSLLPLIKKLIKENACEVENSSNSGNNSNIENEDVFYLIYITGNKIGLSSEFKNIFRDEKVYIQENIPNLPPRLEKDLYNKLKKIKNEINLYINTNNNNNYNNLKTNLNRFDLRLRNTFIELFVEMFNDFYKYLCLLDNNDVVFNKKLFIKGKQFQDRKFYEEFIDTQIFQQFIQTVTINDDLNYFKTMIVHNKIYTKYLSPNSNNKNDSYYFMIPDCFENCNNDIKSIEKIMKEYCYIKDIKTNDNGILPNTQRILSSIKFIDNNKYKNDNCSIYLLPQFKNNNSIYNDKDMEKLNINFLKKFENYKSNIDTINEDDENDTTNSNKIKLNINKKKDIMSEKEKDNLEEYIKDFTIKIFSSEKLNIYNPKLKTEIQNSISNTHGRLYFINLLLKNLSNNNIILLEYSYFNFLGTLIYNLILSTLKIEETDEILEQIIYLIKSMSFFGKKEFDKNGISIITLWNIYKPKIQTNPKVMQINFWNKWYEIEFKTLEEKTDEEIQEIIFRMCDSMICLELPKSFIKNVLKGLADRIFGKDSEKSQNTFNIFIQRIVNAKYISQVLL